MKFLKLFIWATMMMPVLICAQASDLFISEYIEGSSNNKAVEIFNGTGAAVDLSLYKIWRITNGGEWLVNDGNDAEILLSGTLADGDVYVICNNSATQAIKDVADLQTGSASWNGDDAVGLCKSDGVNFTVIDAIGTNGADPGTGWNVAGVANATVDHTLIRKSAITGGTTDWTASAGTTTENSQWEVQAIDYFTNLGSHVFNPGNDTKIQFASASASVNEGDGSYSLTVTILNPSSTTVTTADVALISGAAADLGNYSTQPVTFPAGSSANQTVTVTITDDSEEESSEVFTFELQNISGGTNASAGSPSQFELTVLDNDLDIPQIVINEIMQNPNAVTDADGEWFELYNNDVVSVDINGWKIKDDGSDSHVINNGGPLNIPAGGYLVLGINDTLTINGGVTVNYVYSSFTLGNGDDEVVLIFTDGITEVDRVNYDGGTNFPDPTGASMELVNYNRDNTLGSNWATATAPFGDGDMGTPGAQNSVYVSILHGNESQIIRELRLYQNFPNPFNPSTVITFDAPNGSHKVELSIYDVLGKKVCQLLNEQVSYGTNTYTWDGRNSSGQNMPSGVYFAALKSSGISKTIKMMLMR